MAERIIDVSVAVLSLGGILFVSEFYHAGSKKKAGISRLLDCISSDLDRWHVRVANSFLCVCMEQLSMRFHVARWL